jgi:hypothetical protein
MITRSTVVMVQGLPWDGALYPDHRTELEC